LLAQLSGALSAGQQSYISTTGFMMVVFTSDSSVEGDGFEASWALLDPVRAFNAIYASWLIMFV
jgi:hypothetical protein